MTDTEKLEIQKSAELVGRAITKATKGCGWLVISDKGVKVDGDEGRLKAFWGIVKQFGGDDGFDVEEFNRSTEVLGWDFIAVREDDNNVSFNGSDELLYFDVMNLMGNIVGEDYAAVLRSYYDLDNPTESEEK